MTTPHERLLAFQTAAAEVDYDVDKMRDLYSGFKQGIEDLTESELFSLELHATRQRSQLGSLLGYVGVERARRE